MDFEVEFEESNQSFQAEFKESNQSFKAEFGEFQGGGTRNHNQLINREIPNQHPISAISGLQEELDSKYEKDVDGIPRTDFTQSVQESLEKADSALQEHQSLVGYATEEWVEDKGFLTEHQDISNLATKQELQEVENKIPTKTSNLENDSGYLTKHQDISNLASKQELQTVENKIPTKTSDLTNDSGFLTEHQSLSNYYTKDEVNTKVSNATTNMATQSWVRQQGFITEHQDISGKENASNKVTSLSPLSTDEQYPSAKCIYDVIGNIEAIIDTIRGVV